MTLKQLKAFLVLARTLNYANAANELCLSQSALSLSIKSLEDELGGKLFKRNTRRVDLTAEGNSLIPFAKKLLANWEDMERDVKQRFKLHRGTLNIASMPFATHAVLPAVLHEFNKNHPNINFSIHDIPNEKIIEKVQEDITAAAFRTPQTRRTHRAQQQCANQFGSLALLQINGIAAHHNPRARLADRILINGRRLRHHTLMYRRKMPGLTLQTAQTHGKRLHQLTVFRQFFFQKQHLHTVFDRIGIALAAKNIRQQLQALIQRRAALVIITNIVAVKTQRNSRSHSETSP